MLIDSHCHLHDREFFSEEQAEGMLKRAQENGITKIICIGTSHEDSLAARGFASRHPNVYWTYGIHPEETGAKSSPLGSQSPGPSPWAGAAMARAAALRNPPVGTILTPANAPSSLAPIAIGEVGLDYYHEGYDREAQIKLFEEMLQLAIDNDLPLSFHVRNAFDDFFAVTKNFPKVRGVVHSFTDSKKNLKKILDTTDFYVGVNGLSTYSTLPLPPIERILLETDAPFLAPVPFRGEINEPAHILEIAKWLSEKFGLDLKTVAEITTKNTETLYF